MKPVNKYGLEYAGPRRARRGALKQWLIDLIIGAAAMALLWWLFSLVHHSTAHGAEALTSETLRLAGWSVSSGVAGLIVGVLALGLVMRLWLMARREKLFLLKSPAMEDGEGWADAPGPFEVVDPLADGDTLKREQRAIEGMPSGLTRVDVALICFALASEARLIRELVRGAQRSLGAEDYGDALSGAERRLGDLRTRLWQLKAHFDGDQICARDADDLPKSYGEAAKGNANAGGVS